MSTPTRSAKAPTHEVFAVTRKEPDSKGRWTKIGACWPHEDGDGFNLRLDFLPLDEAGIDDLHPNMFWNSGRRILAAGRFARNHPNLHIIYITNFKCGPDSFIKHFLRDVALSPFLILQFDGHGNDAGYLTRCEAYLDSKGILRCSSKSKVQVA